jgi:hypothetical protein
LKTVSGVAHDNLKKVKPIYIFPKSVFDWGDNSLECFNWATFKLWVVTASPSYIS